MSIITLDTHAAFVRLTKAGMSEEQATAEVENLREFASSIGEKSASKSDVENAIAKLKADLVWYMLAFTVGQVALIVGLIKALH